MQDRNNIKWAPFNSIISDKEIINNILKKQNKINKPILSEDQIEYLNNKVFDSYINHTNIILSIFKNESILNLKGYINNINKQKKYITFNNNHIFFNQILNIKDL